jgi:hypothetical protein
MRPCTLILRLLSGFMWLTRAKTSLTYGCVCANGMQPNVSEYTLTLPYFVCTEWGSQCVANCTDSACQSDCREKHPCGALEPTQQNTTTSSTMSATGTSTATATGSNQVFTGLAGGSSSTSNSPNGSAAPLSVDFGAVYSLMIVVGSLFAGFALML